MLKKIKIITAASALCLAANALIAQPVYSAKEGTATFFSEAPLENIDATSSSVNSFINTSNGEIVFIIPITSFKFQKSLMQEHFNENYMESGTYKNAQYKGKINEPVDFTKDGTYNVSSTGLLTIHGVEKERTIYGSIAVKDGQAKLDSKFKVKLADHDVKIPKVVTENIAEEVEVTLAATYVPHVSQK